jgi:hypothetical protein
VIVATDADSVDPRDYALKVGAIEAGFAGIDADVIGVACVPIGTSEAWLLSDQVSWTKLGATELGNLPRRPERAWGRPHEPSSNHPKCIFVRMCRANDIPDTSETRRSLANLCDMEVLNRLVPISFRPFAQEVKKI